MTALLTRLLALAELAVSEALQFEYGDPEDRHIWRELQELKPLVATALAQPKPQGPTDEELVGAARGKIRILRISPDKSSRMVGFGAPTGGQGTLTSQSFTLTAENLEFSAYAGSTSSGYSYYCRVYKASDNSLLEERTYKAGLPWRNYIIDVTEYIGEEVYVEFYSPNYLFYVDNLRMGSDESAVVVVSAASKGGWTATSGSHTIKAEVDVNDEVLEVAEDNQTLTEDFSIGLPDYVVEDIRYDTNDSGSQKDRDSLHCARP